MGYTTTFEGEFKLDREVSFKTSRLIDRLHEGDESLMGDMRGYCLWQLTEDGTGIEWDGGEKFYDYVKWLDHIIKTILVPNGHTLSGTVHYSGESTTDNGKIVVDNNTVRVIQSTYDDDELAEAQGEIVELKREIKRLKDENRKLRLRVETGGNNG